MIKQHHFPNVAAVTTLFVVLLGGGTANAGTHSKVHDEYVAGHLAHSSHRGQRNIKVKDKHTKNGSPKSRVSKKHILKYIKYKAVGIASWYGYESGNTTAMGTRFNPMNLTAAHRTLPLPSRVRVTNLKNHKVVIVTVNDRGPYAKGRILDLSLAAARAIGIKGTERVRVETIK